MQNECLNTHAALGRYISKENGHRIRRRLHTDIWITATTSADVSVTFPKFRLRRTFPVSLTGSKFPGQLKQAVSTFRVRTEQGSQSSNVIVWRLQFVKIDLIVRLKYINNNYTALWGS